MDDVMTVRAGILQEAQAPAIRIGAIQQAARRTFRRRGGADDIAEFSPAGVRLFSKPGSTEPFDIWLPAQAITIIGINRGWIEHQLWLEADGQRHGLAFRRRTDLDKAVAAVRHVTGIVPR